MPEEAWPNSEPKYLDPKEFRERGYLQEVNRRFFHPLGLALSVVCHDDGKVELGKIIDCRDDPEGFHFADCIDKSKADAVDEEIRSKEQTRIALLGAVIQPI